MLELIDTHCHIHFADYGLDPEQAVADAIKDGVSRLLCVGCTLDDSKMAVEFAKNHENIWSTIGLHPHEAKRYINDELALQQFRDLASQPKVVAIGETGLDYYYQHSSSIEQKQLLKFQLDVATQFNLPMIFHVREAFDDFWKILDSYNGVRGVVHCFSATQKELDEILKRGLYVGLNGIMTFTKNLAQLEAAKAVPLDRMLLETDAPFLTPVPFRGTICQPKHVRVVAEFLADLRQESLEHLATSTTANATTLFNLS